MTRLINADIVLAALDGILTPLTTHPGTHASILRLRVRNLRDLVDQQARVTTDTQPVLIPPTPDGQDVAIGHPDPDSTLVTEEPWLDKRPEPYEVDALTTYGSRMPSTLDGVGPISAYNLGWREGRASVSADGLVQG